MMMMLMMLMMWMIVPMVVHKLHVPHFTSHPERLANLASYKAVSNDENAAWNESVNEGGDPVKRLNHKIHILLFELQNVC